MARDSMKLGIGIAALGIGAYFLLAKGGFSLPGKDSGRGSGCRDGYELADDGLCYPIGGGGGGTVPPTPKQNCENTYGTWYEGWCVDTDMHIINDCGPLGNAYYRTSMDTGILKTWSGFTVDYILGGSHKARRKAFKSCRTGTADMMDTSRYFLVTATMGSATFTYYDNDGEPSYVDSDIVFYRDGSEVKRIGGPRIVGNQKGYGWRDISVPLGSGAGFPAVVCDRVVVDIWEENGSKSKRKITYVNLQIIGDV